MLQVILNVVDFGMNVQDAVDAPRFHHQWKPDKLALEPGFSPDTVALLEARGHNVEHDGPASLASRRSWSRTAAGCKAPPTAGPQQRKAAGY